MIRSFGDDATEDVFHGCSSRHARTIPKAVWRTLLRKLDMLNAATDLRDLSTLPGNRLEPLKGNLAGFYSIRVNKRYRLVFMFKEGSAYNVACQDYHP